MSRRTALVLALTTGLLALAYAGVSNAPPPRGLSADQGLPNFGKVSTNLYRGGQPEPKGYEALAALGIRTVVNLRSAHEDVLPAGAGLRDISIPMKAETPHLDDVRTFLRIVSTPTNLPVFVHCRRGSDRTGLMVASYRIVVEGWDKAKAIEEMKHGGYGFFPGYLDIVSLLNHLDVPTLRTELNLPAAAP